MLSIGIFELFFFSPAILAIIFGWFFFFKINNSIFLLKPLTSDKRQFKVSILKKFYHIIFLKWSIVLHVCVLIFLLAIRGYSSSFFFSHFFVDDFIFRFVIFFYVIGLCCLYILYLNSFIKIAINFDFFFSLFNLIHMLPLLFFSNTFFTVFFFLELSSLLIFYQFLSSRFFYKNLYSFSTLKVSDKITKLLPKNFLNVLFFQYWVSFFSSVLLIFFLIQFTVMFGSSEWAFVNLLNNFFICLRINNTINLIFLFSIFFIGFFFKIGLTPLHLYKVEVYKGLPFLSFFFYTIFYFFIYIYFTVLLLAYYLSSFWLYFWVPFLIFIVFGLFFLISLLFDINLIKSFFAYSTVVNSLTFLCVLLSIFC